MKKFAVKIMTDSGRAATMYILADSIIDAKALLTTLFAKERFLSVPKAVG